MDIENLKEQIAALPPEKQQMIQRLVSYMSKSYPTGYSRLDRYPSFDIITSFIRESPSFIQESFF
ncbi:MAG: hypothetical protein HC924_16610 [Synechococcaceae cyanobacterium SM2_3_2]|nr:hypothetical protein [Synechococcaceae cyanobacterium SM2_3_2]